MISNTGDKFFIYGRVHPSEYDWKTQFSNMAKLINENPKNMYMPVDCGKVLGLCEYIEELEEKLEGYYI